MGVGIKTRRAVHVESIFSTKRLIERAIVVNKSSDIQY